MIDPNRDPLGVGGTVVWRWDLEGEAFGAGMPNQDPDGDLLGRVSRWGWI